MHCKATTQDSPLNIMVRYISDVIRMIAAALFSTSSRVVCQDETLIRIASRPCQTVPPHQQVPSS
jgi:hypothetical protein